MKTAVKRFLLLAVLLAGGTAHGAEFSIREWANDSKVFFAQVIEPTATHFAERGCIEEVDFYVGELFQRLREIKTTVASKSYLLMRDIILSVAEDVAPFEETLNCETIDRWPFFENLIRNNIELIGNVFLIIE